MPKYSRLLKSLNNDIITNVRTRAQSKRLAEANSIVKISLDYPLESTTPSENKSSPIKKAKSHPKKLRKFKKTPIKHINNIKEKNIIEEKNEEEKNIKNITNKKIIEDEEEKNNEISNNLENKNNL